jgi:hypothetical protein
MKPVLIAVSSFLLGGFSYTVYDLRVENSVLRG